MRIKRARGGQQFLQAIRTHLPFFSSSSRSALTFLTMISLPIVLSALATFAAGAVLPLAAPASYKLKTHVVRGNSTLDGLYGAQIYVFTHSCVH
jgi:hypothetical protein